jgi:hypothetical protein
LARKLAVELASIKPQMSKAAIPFAALIAALFVSSTPAFAKGGGNSTAKVSAKMSVHKSAKTPTKITKKPSLTASKPPASGAGAGRPPGYTGTPERAPADLQATPVTVPVPEPADLRAEAARLNCNERAADDLKWIAEDRVKAALALIAEGPSGFHFDAEV